MTMIETELRKWKRNKALSIKVCKFFKKLDKLCF